MRNHVNHQIKTSREGSIDEELNINSS